MLRGFTPACNTSGVWPGTWQASRGAEVRKRFLDVTTGQTALRLARALSSGRRLT